MSEIEDEEEGADELPDDEPEHIARFEMDVGEGEGYTVSERISF